MHFQFLDDPCPQPTQLNSGNLEKCVPVMLTNYFEGSGIGFGFTLVFLASFPFGMNPFANFILYFTCM